MGSLRLRDLKLIHSRVGIQKVPELGLKVIISLGKIKSAKHSDRTSKFEERCLAYYRFLIK